MPALPKGGSHFQDRSPVERSRTPRRKIRAHELLIRHVLYAGFSALIIIVGLSSIFYQNTVRVIRSDFDKLYTLQHLGTTLADVTARVAALHASLGVYAVTPTRQRQDSVSADIAQLTGRLQALRMTETEEPYARLVDDLVGRLNEIDQSFQRYVVARRRVSIPGVRGAVQPSNQEVDNDATEAEKAASAIETAVAGGVAEIGDRLQLTLAESDRKSRLAVLISIFLGAGCAAVIVRLTVQPLYALTRVMELLAGGRLNEEVPYTDRGNEIGQMARATSIFKLAMAELGAARDAAEAAARAKADFLAVMSHEIRTPMNAVVGLSDLLSQARLPNDHHETVLTIRQSTQSLLTLIDNVLDFSKLEEGAFTLERVAFNISDVVEDVGELFATPAEDKGVSLLIDVDPSLRNRRLGDPARLRQVLLNLVVNAVKFTETGSVSVHVEPDGPDGVLFSVTDTGIGLTQEQQSRLFQPFTQADTSTARRYGGTGLGLAICRGLVEIMGSTIKLSSAPGRGSTFSFHLQLPVAAETTPAPRPLRGRTVRVIGDDAARRQTLAHALQAGGAIVRVSPISVAESADMGANMAADAQVTDPDEAIVLDLGGLADDPDAALRAIAAARLRPVVVMSRALRTRIETSRMEGAASVVTSPVRRARLWRSVLAAMQPDDAAQPFQPQSEPVLPELVAPDIDTALAARALILVAEDNPTNQKVILRLLNRLGYTAECVSDGEEALRALDQKPYGLLFADCHMPNLDGFGLVARIRGEELITRRHIPIVALTADALSGTETRCLQAGMDDYLTKPVTLERLDQVVRRWLPAAVALHRKAGTLLVAPQRSAALPPPNGPTHQPDPSTRAAASPMAPGHPSSAAPALAGSADPGLAAAFAASKLATTLGLSAAEMREFLGEFLADASDLVARLQAGLADHDERAAFQAAHALAGAASNVGATALGSVAERIEGHCRSGALTEAAALVPALMLCHEEAKRGIAVTA
jgi:signal transduction histidine kinase/CheY-like chemotaxis protein/HPt (histidine-containing phosphotransfer) domain-containing protein